MPALVLLGVHQHPPACLLSSTCSTGPQSGCIWRFCEPGHRQERLPPKQLHGTGVVLPVTGTIKQSWLGTALQGSAPWCAACAPGLGPRTPSQHTGLGQGFLAAVLCPPCGTAVQHLLPASTILKGPWPAAEGVRNRSLNFSFETPLHGSGAAGTVCIPQFLLLLKNPA